MRSPERKRRLVRPPFSVRRAKARSGRPDRPEVTVSADGLTIISRSAEAGGWRVAAAVYGIPWLATMAVASVWYLGWGVPRGFGVRVMVWIVLVLLTAALHAVAVLTLWGTAYSRAGIETLVIDPTRITLRRQAGRFPIEMHIARGIVETAEELPPGADGRPRPRIEVRASRSAVRFGAGMTEGEAGEVLRVLSAFFEREEYARDALTAATTGATIAPTREDVPAESDAAMTGTSRSTTGHEKRAGTVRARVERWTRRSPRSLGPNDPTQVK